jgi:UrcA family protein
MMKKGKSFFAHTMAGAVGALLLCGGAAAAQDYAGTGTPAPYESVIIHPDANDYGRIESHQLLGHIDGEINPTMMTLSEPVNYSDLDLSRPSGVRALRLRIRDTAMDLCGQLAVRDVGSANDRDANRECVRRAVQTAMADLPVRPEG